MVAWQMGTLMQVEAAQVALVIVPSVLIEVLMAHAASALPHVKLPRKIRRALQIAAIETIGSLVRGRMSLNLIEVGAVVVNTPHLLIA